MPAVGRSDFVSGGQPATTLREATRKRVMGRLRFGAVLILTCLVATPLFAARDDFYLALLHRGMSHVDAGQYDAAVRELQIAGFGLVDNIPDFETAHIYLTIAADKLKNEADARRSAQRVVAAERVERRYGALSFPPSARNAFEQIASKLLTTDQYAFLKSSPATATPSPQPRIATPQPAPAPAPTETTIVVPMPQQQPPVVEPRITVQPLPLTPAPVSHPVAQPVKPPTQQRAAVQPAPQPRVVQPALARPHVNVDAQLTAADTAIERDQLAEAARIYHLLLDDPQLTHEQLLHVGEGAYRARDFADSARALERSGFRGGDEPYRYYYAVALYETGDYTGARRELRAALPYIEVTREVARYRAKIDGAAQ
jgi:hypothetical protein